MKSYKPSHLQKKIKVRNKAVKRRRFVQSRVFFDIALAVILVLLLAYLFLFSEVFKIQDIQIISFTEVPKESIFQIVEKEMQAKVLFFIQNDSFFLVDSKELERKIASQFPLISKVEVKKGLNRSLFVEAKPRIAQTIWCFAPLEARPLTGLATPEPDRAEAGFNNAENCFVVDQQRILFSPMTPEMPKDNLILVNSENPIKPIFSEACSEGLTERIIETNKVLNDFGLFNSTFAEKANGFLYVKTIEGWQVFFSPKQDLASDMLKLRLLLDKEISPEKRKTLEYIDLRFSKAYYK